MSLPTPTQADAERFLRQVVEEEGLGGAVMKPRSVKGGTLLRRLADVANFLRSYDASSLSSSGYRMDIHYVDLELLTSWVRDVIGDTDLAQGLEPLVTDGRAFGPLSSEVKMMLIERVQQCIEVLSAEPEFAGVSDE